MGRKMKRRALKPVTPRWRAVQNALGLWVVVDEHGREPLRCADPLERMRAVYLAAAAPGMHDALAEMVRRLTYLELPYKADARRVAVARDELVASRAPLVVLNGRTVQVPALELDLEGGEVA